jgi:hypothetical protein
MLPLKTICATVRYFPVHWENVTVDEKGIIRPGRVIPWGAPHSIDDDDGDEKPHIEEGKPPRFWQQVRQLYFTFEEGKIPMGFYYQYGGILEDFHSESIEEVRKKLDWFRLLTVMVEWAKAGKLAPLWETFGQPQESKDCKPVFFVNDGSELNIKFSPWFATKGGEISYYTPTDDIFYYTPKNDEQLIQATWEAVTEAMEKYLQAITLVPITQGQPQSKLILWGFQAKGALQAAFLDWFFQEIAHMNVNTCQARGCQNIVLLPRKIYCSERCKEREKKYRQYHKKKK